MLRDGAECKSEYKKMYWKKEEFGGGDAGLSIVLIFFSGENSGICWTAAGEHSIFFIKKPKSIKGFASVLETIYWKINVLKNPSKIINQI